MKRIVKLTGTVLVLLIISAGAISAQRGMRGTPGSKPDSLNMRAFRGPGPQQALPAPGFGRNIMGQPGRNGMRGPGQPNVMRGMNHQGRPGMQGRLSPENRILRIPGLTENQKKELAYLNLKQTETMIKIREDMAAQVKKAREDHKKVVESLLTDEQKKALGTDK